MSYYEEILVLLMLEDKVWCHRRQARDNKDRELEKLICALYIFHLQAAVRGAVQAHRNKMCSLFPQNHQHTSQARLCAERAATADFLQEPHPFTMSPSVHLQPQTIIFPIFRRILTLTHTARLICMHPCCATPSSFATSLADQILTTATAIALIHSSQSHHSTTISLIHSSQSPIDATSASSPQFTPRSSFPTFQRTTKPTAFPITTPTSDAST